MVRRKLLPVNTIRRSSFHAFPDAYRDATKGIDYGDSAALAFRVSFLASDPTSVKSRETWKKVRHLADILAGVPKKCRALKDRVRFGDCRRGTEPHRIVSLFSVSYVQCVTAYAATLVTSGPHDRSGPGSCFAANSPRAASIAATGADGGVGDWSGWTQPQAPKARRQTTWSCPTSRRMTASRF